MERKRNTRVPIKEQNTSIVYPFERNPEDIDDCDLMKYEFTIEELEKNVQKLDIMTILYSQTLNADFCAKYILSEKYVGHSVEEEYITNKNILFYQPHIDPKELARAYYKYDTLYTDEQVNAEIQRLNMIETPRQKVT